MSQENWIKEETPKSIRKVAQETLDKIKAERSKRETKLVKICDKPLTYKEVLI